MRCQVSTGKVERRKQEKMRRKRVGETDDELRAIFERGNAAEGSGMLGGSSRTLSGRGERKEEDELGVGEVLDSSDGGGGSDGCGYAGRVEGTERG